MCACTWVCRHARTSAPAEHTGTPSSARGGTPDPPSTPPFGGVTGAAGTGRTHRWGSGSRAGSARPARRPDPPAGPGSAAGSGWHRPPAPCRAGSPSLQSTATSVPVTPIPPQLSVAPKPSVPSQVTQVPPAAPRALPGPPSPPCPLCPPEAPHAPHALPGPSMRPQAPHAVPQGWGLQRRRWCLSPGQRCPPFFGGGRVQERLRMERPPPHVRSHRDQGLQADQAPSTAMCREGIKRGALPRPASRVPPIDPQPAPQAPLLKPPNQLPWVPHAVPSPPRCPP